MQGSPTVVEALANEAVATYGRTKPESTRDGAIRAFVDWAGVTRAGASGIMASALTHAMLDGDGDDPCRVMGGGRRASAQAAALINGTAAHSLELDDIYSPGLFHPGAPIISAAFAVAELLHASGERLLDAIVVGYEVGDRVASDLGPEHYRLFHTTGTAGALGAATACGTIAGLDSGQLADALAISATLACGLQQTFRTSAVAKPLHAGHAAQAGVISALAAQHGASGARDVLEGPAGMAAALAGDPSWAAARGRFGPSYLIEQTTTKAYPCCGHTFAAIDAARELLADGVAVQDIVEVLVETYSAAVDVAGIRQPRTPAEAKFSIAFTVAVTLLDGGIDLTSFAEQNVSSARVIALAERVQVDRADEFTAPFPERRGARVLARLRDGRTMVALVPDRFGSPTNPMSEAQLERKFVDLVPCEPDRQPVQTILSGLRNIESVQDVCDLVL